MATPETVPLLGAAGARFEFNGVAASAVVFAAIALEALGMLPSESASDVPASLRCTTIVLIVLCGGPIVGAHRAHSLPGMSFRALKPLTCRNRRRSLSHLLVRLLACSSYFCVFM